MRQQVAKLGLLTGVLAWALWGCEGEQRGGNRPAAAQEPEPPAQVEDEPAPSRGARASEAKPARKPRGPAAKDTEPAPTLGCRVEGKVVLGRNLSAGRVVTRGEGLWVASYARALGKRSLARFVVNPDLEVRALPRLPLGEAGETPPKVPPAIATGAGLWVAGTDAKGALSMWPDAEVDAPEPIKVARRVDLRFAPALRELAPGRALLAYTEGDATGMRVRAVVAEGESLTRHAITPREHGATAPRFVAGEAAPQLIMLDARSGMSPLLRVAFDSAGLPAPAVVERPVNLPYSPPSIAALRLGEGKRHVAYTAVGNGATAAVGLVPLEDADTPVAVLRGTGYALLSVDAAVGPRHALFAVDAPLHGEPDPPLEVQVRVWNGSDFGEPLRLEGGGKSRMRPSVAYDAESGRVALVSQVGESLELHRLHCDL